MNGPAVIGQAAVLIAALDVRVESDTDLLCVLSGLQTLSQMVEAQKLVRLREAEARNLPSAVGAAHPVPWTADLLKVSRRTAARLRRLNQVLAGAPLVADAFAAGEISAEQARVMADTVKLLPAGGESLVLARGADLAPDELRVVLREVQEEFDPAGTQERDETAAARAEERARERRRVSLSRLDGSNLIRIDGYLG